MSKIFGSSDDLVEIERAYPDTGDEIPCPDGKECKLLFDDGTCITISYGKGNLAVWRISVNRVGTAAHVLTECNDENASVYSDVFEIEAAIKRHLVTRRNSTLFFCPECGAFMQPEITPLTAIGFPPRKLICENCSYVESTKTYQIEVKP